MQMLYSMFTSSFESILISISAFSTLALPVTVRLTQCCCWATLEVSSGLLYWCRAPLGAVMYFIPSIRGAWRPGNLTLRAQTGHRWQSKIRRHLEMAGLWGNLLITGGLYMETAWSKGLYKNAVGVVAVGESYGSMARFWLHKTFQCLHHKEREQKQQQKLYPC